MKIWQSFKSFLKKPIYNLYATTKKEKLRAYLACFDAEVLLYSVTNIETQTPCLLVFLSSLRYLAKNIKLKDWEGKRYLTGAAVFSLISRAL